MSIDEFIATLKSIRVEHFFHFTDSRNIESIRARGLLSTRILRDAGINAVTGGNQWSLDADAHAGMDAFVHLCFFSKHPMEFLARKEGRIERTTFVRIAPEVLKMPGVLITKDVANKSGIVPLPVDKALPQLDYTAMYTRINWKVPENYERRKAVEKYEILVPDCVPINLLSGL